MTTNRTAGRAGALLIPLALVVAACGGGTSSATPAVSSGTSDATASAGAVATPETGSGESPGASSALAIPSFDIGEITKGLDNVDSYRVSIGRNGVEQINGVVVTKPVLSRDITLSGGTRIFVIGKEAWSAQGDEPLKSVPDQLASTMFAAYDPTLLVGSFTGPEWARSSLDKGTEQKNGINAHHFVIDKTTAVGGLAGLPAGASLNIWIADEGYLVAWESKGFAGGDTSIQVTNVDDPANKVERPS